MDDVIMNKIAVINKCLLRINEEYVNHEDEISYNYTKQDSIILNLQRVCEASLDLGTRVIRINNLGIPQTSRDVFVLLEEAKIIPTELSKKLQAMIGFRNIAVHDYQKLNLDIVHSIIRNNLSDFESFISIMKKVQTH